MKIGTENCQVGPDNDKKLKWNRQFSSLKLKMSHCKYEMSKSL